MGGGQAAQARIHAGFVCMKLRPYQQRAIDLLYRWLRDNRGNPCLVMPTGSGKSHVIAALCQDALTSWPDTRILMLTHVKELIKQNAAKLYGHWFGAPLGIYSAGLGRRDIDAITFAGIMSVCKKAEQLGHVDLVIVDEAHLIGHRDQGAYRDLIRDLQEINPALRVVGLTATPYRLGHGLITDEPALFHGLIEPVTINELIYLGHLAPLRSKATTARLSVDGVHKRGGEYIESELQRAVDNDDDNERVVDEMMGLAEGRKAWLFFCAGVSHAEHVADVLRSRGVVAACVTGKTPRDERDAMLDGFREGKIRAITNANVLTTGFDYPDLDLIVMLRPTMSAGLYVQMAGRGMRIKSHTDHCLVLDFAGVVEQHGPITAVIPSTATSGSGKASTRKCKVCKEIYSASASACPSCGTEPPPPEEQRPDMWLHDDDIMGDDIKKMSVGSWTWRKHVSKSSGKEMLRVTYYPESLTGQSVNEYLCVRHEGYAGMKALSLLATIANCSGCFSEMSGDMPLAEAASILQNSPAPTRIIYKRDGKFFRVVHRTWEEGL